MTSTRQQQWALLLLILAGAQSDIVNDGADRVQVLQTKGLHLLHHGKILASGVIQTQFGTVIPQMLDGNNTAPLMCSGDKGTFIDKICSTLQHLDERADALIVELATVFKSLHGPKRVKRETFQETGLLPFMGKISKYLFGQATENDVEIVINNINKLGNDVKILKNNTATLVNAVNQNAYQMDLLSKQVETRLQKFVDIHNELLTEIDNMKSDSQRLLAAVVVNLVWSSKVSLLTSHLLVIREIYHSCHRGRLSRLAVPERQLSRFLSDKQKSLAETGVELAVPLNEIDMYYSMKNVQCFRKGELQLRISISIPIIKINSKYQIFTLKPIKFLLDAMTCQILEEEKIFASDGTSVRSLRTTLTDDDVYLLPRFNSPNDLSMCVLGILHEKDPRTLAKACHVTCDVTNATTVQPISDNEYIVLNPAASLEILCANQVVKRIQPIFAGSVKISLPCHCALQEMHSNRVSILVYAMDNCFVNADVSKGLIVDQNWTNDDISISDLAYLNKSPQNVTKLEMEPIQLNIQTVRPIPATTEWEPVRVIGSNWFQTGFFFTVVVMVLGALAYCLIFQTNVCRKTEFSTPV